MDKNNYFVHSTSIVDDNVSIGNNTKIWHFSHISEGASIGQSCTLGQNVFIGNNVVIGNNVKIQNNVSIYEKVILKDDVFCGPSVVFTNVSRPRSFIDQKNNYSQTIINKGVTLGANSTIVCGVTLGEYSFIGAGALVNKNVPNFALMVGNPAKQIGWVGLDGEKLDIPLIGNGRFSDKNDKYSYLLNKNILIIDKVL
jgi:UDP-2-acetamido-3-amino-2,3-dideoxy-glucuronate N-acetyltransferase